MKNKIFQNLVTLTIAILISGCCQQKIVLSNKLDKISVLDTSQCRSLLKDDFSGCFIVDFEEMRLADSVLENYLNENKDIFINQVKKPCPNINKEINFYCRQYIGLLNIEGDKFVFVNFIHKNVISRHKNWKAEIIQVYDGCSNYWFAIIDIEHKKCLKVTINSGA